MSDVDRELLDATEQTETVRVAALAVEHGLTLPRPDELPLDETPELCRPAARLFATVNTDLRALGADALPFLSDARYDAVTRRLAELLPATGEPCEHVDVDDLARGFDRALVELDALRGVTPFLLDLRTELRRQTIRSTLLAPGTKANGAKR